MRKVLLLSGFFIATPVTFLVALLLLLVITYQKTPNGNGLFAKNPAVAYAALPTNENVFSAEITPEKSKEEALHQFLAKYHSPLIAYTKFIIDTADTYGLDYRLIPAIAMQETNLCAKAKEDSHNCWGYGVTGGKYKFFESYEQGIETVTRTLAEHYRDKHGLVTPEEIQKMYTPSSDGSWADSVTYFRDQL
jgi:hypothetical protein